MWSDVFKLAVANGLWCVLFVILFFYQLKDSKQREQRYISIIEELSESFKTVREIDDKLDALSEAVQRELRKRGDE